MQEEKKLNLPRRIKGRHYTTFREYPIESNYYSVSIVNNIQDIFIFKVVFNPFIPPDNTKARYALLNLGMEDIKACISSPVFCGANIYSLKEPVSKECEIKVEDTIIKIKHVKTIQVSKNPRALLMFLNNGLRNMFRKIGYIEIGKTGKFFKTASPSDLDADLKVFSGFKANFMVLEKGIYLRVDTAKKIVRNETVLDYINTVYNKNSTKDREQKRTILKNLLIGQIIMTNYGKARYAKIIDLIFDTIDDFKLNGTETTLRQFYESKYSRKIQNPKQPLIQIEARSKNKGDRAVLIPQLCLMTGIPDSFDEFKRKKISQATIRSPADKKADIDFFMKQAQQVNDLSSLKEIGIKLDNRLSKVKAKIIPSPKLELGNSRAVENGKQANFQLFRDPIFDNKYSIKCGIFTTQNADVRGLLDTFKNTARNLNVKFDYDVFSTRENEKHRILSSYFNQIEHSIKKDGINMCLIVIPQFLKQNYGEIKKECLKRFSIVSQCVVDSTLRKKNLQSIATKLLLQMIAKRGNVLWVPKTTGKISSAMIMAFDNAKGHRGGNLACTATMNDTYSNYYSQFLSYENNEDKFNAMVKLSFQAINQYTRKNSKPPKEVIIFHSSCTGDQVNLFRNLFIDTLSQKLQDVFGDNLRSNLSLVMVNTKTSQRFFTTDRNGTRNVNAGTIIADDIVSQNYDFYLVSQGSNRGSTVPNHYKVIYSNSEIQEGLLHELIFSQCFNYVNWTDSIKIPGILQYAKKCAKFAAEALDGEKIMQEMDSKLYYV